MTGIFHCCVWLPEGKPLASWLVGGWILSNKSNMRVFGPPQFPWMAELYFSRAVVDCEVSPILDRCICDSNQSSTNSEARTHCTVNSRVLPLDALERPFRHQAWLASIPTRNLLVVWLAIWSFCQPAFVSSQLAFCHFHGCDGVWKT